MAKMTSFVGYKADVLKVTVMEVRLLVSLTKHIFLRRYELLITYFFYQIQQVLFSI